MIENLDLVEYVSKTDVDVLRSQRELTKPSKLDIKRELL